MKILRRLFAKCTASPFQVGDRVQDPWGNKYTVTESNPESENGLGTIRTRDDDGKEHIFAMIAHGLTLLPHNEAGPAEPNRFEVKRVRPEESAASAYQQAGQIILHGNCITNYGNLACEPYVAL